MRILRQHIEKLGYKRNFVIYDESEQIGAMKKILAQISAKGEKTDPMAVLGLAEPVQERRRTALGFSVTHRFGPWRSMYARRYEIGFAGLQRRGF